MNREKELRRRIANITFQRRELLKEQREYRLELEEIKSAND